MQLTRIAQTVLLTLLAGTASAATLDSTREQIATQAKALEPELLETRRDIHANPELGNTEKRTAELVARQLKAMGLEVKTNVARTGVVAILKGALPGPTVALRADMDALPVKEVADLPFASKAKGTYLDKEVDVMHACGHDAHTAILLSTAKILTGLRDTLPGTVVFYFQPAEEGPSDFIPDGKNTWGAKMMVQEGVMKSPKPDAVFGLHVWAGVPAARSPTAPAPLWPAPTTCASKSSANRPTPAARGTASTRSPSAHKPSSACKPWSAAAPTFRPTRRWSASAPSTAAPATTSFPNPWT